MEQRRQNPPVDPHSEVVHHSMLAYKCFLKKKTKSCLMTYFYNPSKGGKGAQSIF